VRELENCLHRAVLLAEGETIDAEAIDLGPAAAPLAAAAPTSGGNPTTGGTAIESLVGQRMEDVERALILGTLAHTVGNRTHAATILGISIRALRNKLRDYAAQGLDITPPASGVIAPGVMAPGVMAPGVIAPGMGATGMGATGMGATGMGATGMGADA
jgi:hypothetical protein